MGNAWGCRELLDPAAVQQLLGQKGLGGQLQQPVTGDAQQLGRPVVAVEHRPLGIQPHHPLPKQLDQAGEALGQLFILFYQDGDPGGGGILAGKKNQKPPGAQQIGAIQPVGQLHNGGNIDQPGAQVHGFTGPRGDQLGFPGGDRQLHPLQGRAAGVVGEKLQMAIARLAELGDHLFRHEFGHIYYGNPGALGESIQPTRVRRWRLRLRETTVRPRSRLRRTSGNSAADMAEVSTTSVCWGP